MVRISGRCIYERVNCTVKIFECCIFTSIFALYTPIIFLFLFKKNHLKFLHSKNPIKISHQKILASKFYSFPKLPTITFNFQSNSKLVFQVGTFVLVLLNFHVQLRKTCKCSHGYHSKRTGLILVFICEFFLFFSISTNFSLRGLLCLLSSISIPVNI
jgi:hypothetical protein